MTRLARRSAGTMLLFAVAACGETLVVGSLHEDAGSEPGHFVPDPGCDGDPSCARPATSCIGQPVGALCEPCVDGSPNCGSGVASVWRCDEAGACTAEGAGEADAGLE